MPRREHDCFFSEHGYARYQHFSLLRRESTNKAGASFEPRNFSMERHRSSTGDQIPLARSRLIRPPHRRQFRADRDALANGRRVGEGVGVVRLLSEWPVDAGEVLLQEHAHDAPFDVLQVVEAHAVAGEPLFGILGVDPDREASGGVGRPSGARAGPAPSPRRTRTPVPARTGRRRRPVPRRSAARCRGGPAGRGSSSP